MNIIYGKSIYAAVLFLGLLAAISTLSWMQTPRTSAQSSSSADAIAIRVFPNPDHYSALRWYRARNFTGSPQSLIVDGYEAVRDGQTVYVNAANVDLSVNKLYTNIYIITYNLDAETATRDIFSQILAHWNFNSNLLSGETWDGEAATCSDDNAYRCLKDTDCVGRGYCSSAKSQVTRDTIRLARLYDIEEKVAAYGRQNGRYPELKAGTYLPGISLSVWPSWQATLAQSLASPLPVDPLNRLADCGGDRFHPVTCWDDAVKQFAWPDDIKDATLPDGNNVFLYKHGTAGNPNGYSLCAFSETGMFPDAAKMCNGACLRACYGKDCGPDGCGGDCGECGESRTCADGKCLSECASAPGCRPSLLRGHTISGLCPAGNACYECDLGYSWNAEEGTCIGSASCNIRNQPNCHNPLAVPLNAVRYTSGYCPDPTKLCYQCPDGLIWDGFFCNTSCTTSCTTAGEPNCRTTKPANTVTGVGYCCDLSTECYQCDAGYILNPAGEDCFCPPFSIDAIEDMTVYADPPGSNKIDYTPDLVVVSLESDSPKPVTYSIANGPEWLKINGNLLTGSQSEDVDMTYSVTIRADNLCGLDDTETFSLTVRRKPWCGDSEIQSQPPNGWSVNEDCDDGANGIDTDQCFDDCSSTYCGDLILQTPNGENFPEECDTPVKDVPCAWTYDNPCQYCKSDCTYEQIGDYCGDEVRQAGNGEGCDEGLENGDVCVPDYDSTCSYCGDDCTNVTLSGGFCGDLKVNGPEQCDWGGLNGNVCTVAPGGSCTYCDAYCNLRTFGCGDGLPNNGETCPTCRFDYTGSWTGLCYYDVPTTNLGALHGYYMVVIDDYRNDPSSPAAGNLNSFCQFGGLYLGGNMNYTCANVQEITTATGQKECSPSLLKTSSNSLWGTRNPYYDFSNNTCSSCGWPPCNSFYCGMESYLYTVTCYN